MDTTAHQNGATAERRVVGIIAVHPRGFGFLDLESPTADQPASAFVPPPALNTLIAGDRVEASLVPQAGGRFLARDLTRLSRSRTALIGEVTSHRGRLYLRPDPNVANTDWPLIPPSAGPRPVEGACWVARFDGDDLVAERTVSEADQGLERVVLQHNLRTAYPAFEIPTLNTDGRRDLRDLVTVTIDAPVSRDLDDAISVMPAGPDGAVRLLVSIADVDAAVPEGSPLDEEARLRATSVYLPGRVIPMLPPALSEDALSLMPGVERGAMTVELRIDVEGEITATDIYPSLIRSNARLDYKTVARFLDGGEGDDLPAEVLPTLAWARTAAARIGASRGARGGVRLLREEVKIILDDDGEPLQAEAQTATSAHVLIERLMVATNESVARWMNARGLAAVYRVHDAPNSAAVAALTRSAQLAGFEPGFGDAITPRGLAAFEQQFAETPAALAMYAVLAQVLGPARYTVHASAHFGLGAPLYLHFTSPIRRYADLMVHRLIKGYLAGQRDRVSGEAAIEPVCLHINDRAWQATKAEARRRFQLAARLFSQRIGEELRGHVVAVKQFGLIVQLEGEGVSGAVPVDDLPEGPYAFDRDAAALVGPRLAFGVGMPVHVQVASTDEALGRIELRMV